MKKLLCILLVGAIAFTACQKELDDLEADTGNNGGGDNNGGDNGDSITSIIGTYNFISIDAKTKSIGTIDISGVESKTILFLDYITTNNMGTVAIDDSTMTATGLSYTASDSIRTYTYENDVLIDSAIQPLEFTLPATNSSGKYKLIGADSIYFTEGGLVSVEGASVNSQPSGGRISFNGDTLKLSQSISIDTIMNLSGFFYHVTQTGTAVVTMHKK